MGFNSGYKGLTCFAAKESDMSKTERFVHTHIVLLAQSYLLLLPL